MRFFPVVCMRFFCTRECTPICYMARSYINVSLGTHNLLASFVCWRFVVLMEMLWYRLIRHQIREMALLPCAWCCSPLRRNFHFYVIIYLSLTMQQIAFGRKVICKRKNEWEILCFPHLLFYFAYLSFAMSQYVGLLILDVVAHREFGCMMHSPSRLEYIFLHLKKAEKWGNRHCAYLTNGGTAISYFWFV